MASLYFTDPAGPSITLGVNGETVSARSAQIEQHQPTVPGDGGKAKRRMTESVWTNF